MKKTAILLLVIVSSLLLVGCDNEQPILIDTNLETHINTMDALNTYVIKFYTDKELNNIKSVSSNYVYIDSANETFVVSTMDKECYDILHTDLVFQYDEDGLFNFIYNDGWIKHEIDSTFINIINFESVVFDHFKDPTIEDTDTETVYTAHLSLEDIKDSGYTAFGGSVPEKYFNIEIPLSIAFNKTEERFTTFEFDFKPILEAMNLDEGLETQDEDIWNVTFEYTKLNEEFNLEITEYVVDDYIGDFDHEVFSIIKEMYSYDLIDGCVNYTDDSDLIKIRFEESGLYQLSLRAFNQTSDLVVKVLDKNHEIIRTFTLNSKDTATSYWNYTKGTYYVLVSGVLKDDTAADYSLIFMGN